MWWVGPSAHTGASWLAGSWGRLADGWRAPGEGRWAADGPWYARHAGGHRAGMIRAVPGTMAAIVNSR